MKLLYLLFRGFVTQIHNVTLCLWRRNEGLKCHFPRIWGPKIHKFSPQGQTWWPLTLTQAKLPVKSFCKLDRSDQYDSKTCGNICIQIANEIKQRTKQLGFFRYKIICHIIMFSLNRQSMRIANRFLWDEKNDRMISCQYMGKTFGAIVTLSGCYFEWYFHES